MPLPWDMQIPAILPVIYLHSWHIACQHTHSHTPTIGLQKANKVIVLFKNTFDLTDPLREVQKFPKPIFWELPPAVTHRNFHLEFQENKLYTHMRVCVCGCTCILWEKHCVHESGTLHGEALKTCLWTDKQQSKLSESSVSFNGNSSSCDALSDS